MLLLKPSFSIPSMLPLLYLQYIMLLLKREFMDEELCVERFTIHNASIKTKLKENRFAIFVVFTIHNASIKTKHVFYANGTIKAFTIHNASIKTR